MTASTILKSTPVLFVDRIEPSLPFWQERLGFERPTELPGPGGKDLGFVILTNGAVEIMYETRAMLAEDMPHQAAAHSGDKSCLFVEVADIAAIAQALDGFEIVLPRRRTFYGSTEIGYREPGGHYVTFAQFKR